MLLRSLRRWSQQKYILFHFNTTFTKPWLWKRNNDFSTYCYYVHYAMILTKKLFFCCCHYAHYAMIMTKKANYFSFQHYFHYAFIMKIKYYVAIAITFTTLWSQQEINLFSFQPYLHYTMSWEKCRSIVSLRKFSVSKRFVHGTVVSPSGISVESLSIFFFGKFNIFKRFVHNTLVSSSGTSVLYCPIIIDEKLMIFLCFNSWQWWRSWYPDS